VQEAFHACPGILGLGLQWLHGGVVLLATVAVVVSCSSLRGLGWIQDRGVPAVGFSGGSAGGRRERTAMRAWEGARDATRTGGEAPGERARAGHDGEADPVNGSTQQSPSSRPISGLHDQETGLDWDERPLHLGRLELLKAGMMVCLGAL
jgi:hypothetical protein